MPRRGSAEPAAPERTCVGCRRRAPQRELLRVALDGTRVVADPLRRAPGRGAYLHRDPRCVEQARRRRAFRRAFRLGDVAVDTSALDGDAVNTVVQPR